MWTFSLWSVLTFVVCDWDDCVLRNFEGAIHFGILNARWLLYTLNRFVFLNTSFTQRGKRVGGNKACLHLPKITVLCRANSRLEIETFSGGEHRVQGLIISLKACQRGRQSRWSGQSQSHLFHPTAQPTSCPWEINTLRTWAWRNDGCFPCVVYICASQKNKSIYNLKSYSRENTKDVNGRSNITEPLQIVFCFFLIIISYCCFNLCQSCATVLVIGSQVGIDGMDPHGSPLPPPHTLFKRYILGPRTQQHSRRRNGSRGPGTRRRETFLKWWIDIFLDYFIAWYEHLRGTIRNSGTSLQLNKRQSCTRKAAMRKKKNGIGLVS